MKFHHKVVIAHIIIVAFAYVKNTWVINPFNSAYSLFMPRYNNQEMVNIGSPEVLDILDGQIRLVSVVIYSGLFFITFLILLWWLYQKIKLPAYIYIGFSLSVLFFWVLNYFFNHPDLYLIAMNIKDFLQSPVFFFFVAVLLYLIDKEKFTSKKQESIS